jgi:hypothetical protein
MTAHEAPTRPAARPFAWRTFALLIGAALLGAAWAYYNFLSTGGQRGQDELRPLVWTIFATPFALFLGWTLARRAEVWLAAFCCFCLYFFTVFVAARIESLVYSPEAAAATNHDLYFQAVIVLHLIGAAGLAVWRARQPAPATAASPPPAAGQPLESPSHET